MRVPVCARTWRSELAAVGRGKEASWPTQGTSTAVERHSARNAGMKTAAAADRRRRAARQVDAAGDAGKPRLERLLQPAPEGLRRRRGLDVSLPFSRYFASVGTIVR